MSHKQKTIAIKPSTEKVILHQEMAMMKKKLPKSA